MRIREMIRPRTRRPVPGLAIGGLAVLIGWGVQPAAMADGPSEARSYDGWGNNPDEPAWGNSGQQMIRFGYFPEYPGDETGSTMIQWEHRPNARVISNRLSAQTASNPNARGLSSFIWQWGQFVTHDMDLTPNGPQYGQDHIMITEGDDPMGVGNMIPFFRSSFDPSTGTTAVNARQQMNEVTSFIDASNVYGSDTTRADALRAFTGGKLIMNDDNLLGYNTEGLANDNPVRRVPGEQLFLAGDVRANEQPGLTAMHTVFAREHNRLADLIADSGLASTDEDIYQWARKIVGAQMQIITYNEFLPALMGPGAPRVEDFRYTQVEPDVTQTFAHALFRFGHSMSTSELLLVDNNGHQTGTAALNDVFFNPKFLDDNPGNLDLIIKGLASQFAEENDLEMVDEIRNQLFENPGVTPAIAGVDLMALDIQRGRDHGLTNYNETRESYGLPMVSSVTEITSDPVVQQALTEMYGLVEGDEDTFRHLDLFVAALAEDHVPGTSVGITTAIVLISQFDRLRDGDRLFYVNDPDLYDDEGSLHPEIAAIIDLESVKLSDIIRWNTGITDLQANVFVVPEPGGAVILFAAGLGMVWARRRRGKA